jgi:DNA-binding HxlR family transcriptional regulator
MRKPTPTTTGILDAECPTLKVLDVIANKWTVLVIYALSRGTSRHSQLRESIRGVSQKMLTQTLRRLETDGLVRREIYPVVPPKVEYSLTPLGETLIEPLTAICHWAEAHLAEMEAARQDQTRIQSVE